ncbi:hypothetical protein FRX31_002278 [Thalictrum thalictroides]|uniref:DUF4283 domain-containing protein n=1 Tax=Thalictrum thalictroides TaxID=46969 RepID=A0A7J6XGH4_THATH|nr:hypothetical protein FRX31_002278 [Thalictrum thalictroides]
MAGKDISKDIESLRSEPHVPRKAMDWPKAPVSWSSLFQLGNGSKLKTTLNHFTPMFSDGVAEVPDDVIQKGQREWDDYLIGSFVGKRLLYPMVKAAVQKQWGIQAFDMVADADVFYFKFHSEQDKMAAIDKGPIFIAGRLFVVRFWSPESEKGKNFISSIPIWVKFEDVPKNLWSEDGLGFLASLIGKHVCLDDATANKTRLKFAKVTTYWKKNDSAGPSCVRKSQGVEISADVRVVSECGVVARVSPPSSPKVTYGGADNNAAKTVI